MNSEGQKSNRPQCIYFDVSCTNNNNINTGIQRVVRNILRLAPSIANGFSINVEAIEFSENRFRRLAVEDVAKRTSRYMVPIPSEFRRQLTIFPYRCYGLVRQAIVFCLPFDGVKTFIWAPNSKPGLSRILRKFLRPVGIFRGNPQKFDIKAPTQIDQHPQGAGNILVLIDSSWVLPTTFWDCVNEFKADGGRVVTVVYDLIPVSNPEYYSIELSVAFRSWINAVFATTDAIVCISRYSAECVRQMAEAKFQSGAIERKPPISHFHLGSDLDLIRSSGTVSPNIKSIFSRLGHLFLVVGSIEPRKNHDYIISNFDKFWANNGQGTLIIIGRQGWGQKDFLKKIARHPKLGTELYIIRDAGDADLDYAYKSASALIFASKIEGFGLPIVEAFQRGLEVLCSDIPVFREIAEGRATFFDLESPTSLATALKGFCATRSMDIKTDKAPQPWLTWEQSTRELFREIFGTLDLDANEHQDADSAIASQDRPAVTTSVV